MPQDHDSNEIRNEIIFVFIKTLKMCTHNRAGFV